jgi:hypothetical protein
LTAIDKQLQSAAGSVALFRPLTSAISLVLVAHNPFACCKEVRMKLIATIVATMLLTSSVALAGMPSTYQVTGPILDVKPDMITVQKGKEKWEIARDKDTKVTGDLKVGSKVTIYYRMKAASIEAKDAAKKK